jgi:hypothetical protein
LIVLTGTASVAPAAFDWFGFVEWVVGILVAGVLAYFPLSKWAKPAPNMQVVWQLAQSRDAAVMPFTANRQVWFNLHNFSDVPAFNVKAVVLTPEWPDALIDWKNPFGKDDSIQAIIGTQDLEYGVNANGLKGNVPKDSDADPIIPSVRVTWFDTKHGKKEQRKDFTWLGDVA